MTLKDTKDADKQRERAAKRTYHSPESNLEIAMLARKKVRRMLNVLDKIAVDPKEAAGPRVAAAKSVIVFAQLSKEDVGKLSDAEVSRMAEMIIKSRSESPEDAKSLLEAVEAAETIQ